MLLHISTVKCTEILAHCLSHEFKSKNETLKITTVLLRQNVKTI